MKVLLNVLTITLLNLMIFSGAVSAQTFKATIAGQVTDSTGASVSERRCPPLLKTQRTKVRP